MNSDLPPEIRADLLDDFFTEGDEHLTHIRESLVLLEKSVGKAEVDSSVIEVLFRNFHSLKGISAIVGLRAAEELAHAAEDFLRDLRSGKALLSRHGLDLLMSATQRLEQIVVAFRSGEPLPDNGALLEQLKAICSPESGRAQSSSPSPAQVLSPSLIGYLEGARERGLVIWRCSFRPSRELDARGVNINSVRARLSASGEILYSAPKVLDEGEIAFEFLLGMHETPSDITSWDADGITVELLEQPAAAERSDSFKASAAGASDAEASPFIAPSHVVRVDLKRLDELMRITGEMVIHRSRFDEEINQSSRRGHAVDIRILQEVNTRISKSLRELREAIMRVRLVSVAEIFARMPFVVRDLARESKKKVRLNLEGQHTEVDKYLIEQLKDPLLHLVRNAFSHGVETPDERTRRGKPEEATILLSAATVGDSVVIRVRDDGEGINLKAIAARAKLLGLNLPDSLDSGSLLEILCYPGFTTREDADRASGRGVGMAVVRTKVHELGGTISVETEEHIGTQFTLRLPLTLAIAETLIVSAAGQTCAIPQSFVSEAIQVSSEQIRVVNGVEVIAYRSGVLPIVRLASLFRIKEQPQPSFGVLVLTSDRGRTGLLVEKIQGQKEVVVRAIRDPFIQVRGISGATELGDGRPVLILDGSVLTSGPIRPHEVEAPRALAV